MVSSFAYPEVILPEVKVNRSLFIQFSLLSLKIQGDFNRNNHTFFFRKIAELLYDRQFFIDAARINKIPIFK